MTPIYFEIARDKFEFFFFISEENNNSLITVKYYIREKKENRRNWQEPTKLKHKN